MSEEEIYEIQKRKLVKKNQKSEEEQQIEGSQSSGTQELSRSFDSAKSHEKITTKQKDSTKLHLQQKFLRQKQNEKLPKNNQGIGLMTQNSTERSLIKSEHPRLQNTESNSEQKSTSRKQQTQKKQSEQNTTTLQQNKRAVHILAVSDNHGDYKAMNLILEQKGDIFIHAGDFTYQGRDEDFQKFFNFLDKLKFTLKIVIAGNHENVLWKFKLKTITKLKKRCIYLEHQKIEIEGVKIFASPFTPEYCEKPTSRAFQYKPSHDKLIWESIPKDIDLLITHGPPYGVLDNGKNGKRAGSQGLKEAVLKIKPKYHIFGHIHESKGGMMKIGETSFINLCNTPTKLIIKVEKKEQNLKDQ